MMRNAVGLSGFVICRPAAAKAKSRNPVSRMIGRIGGCTPAPMMTPYLTLSL